MFVKLVRLWAILASGGKFLSRKLTVCVVRMRSLLGWMTVMAVELVGWDVMVEGMTSDFDAAVSMKAVVDRSGGLAQPVS